MDIGDIDKDGDTNFFLGSFIFSMADVTKLLLKGFESFPQVLILRNDKNKEPGIF